MDAPGAGIQDGAFAPRLRGWLYRFALERGYLDVLIVRFVVRPFVALFRWFDATERRWTAQLNGEQPPAAPVAPPVSEAAPISAPAAPAPTAAPSPVPTEPAAERHA